MSTIRTEPEIEVLDLWCPTCHAEPLANCTRSRDHRYTTDRPTAEVDPHDARGELQELAIRLSQEFYDEHNSVGLGVAERFAVMALERLRTEGALVRKLA